MVPPPAGSCPRTRPDGIIVHFILQGRGTLHFQIPRQVSSVSKSLRFFDFANALPPADLACPWFVNFLVVLSNVTVERKTKSGYASAFLSRPVSNLSTPSQHTPERGSHMSFRAKFLATGRFKLGCIHPRHSPMPCTVGFRAEQRLGANSTVPLEPEKSERSCQQQVA